MLFYFNEDGIFIFWLSSGQLIVTLANLEGEESFDISCVGHAEEVVQEKICDDELILIKGYLYPYILCFLVISYTQLT